MASNMDTVFLAHAARVPPAYLTSTDLVAICGQRDRETHRHMREQTLARSTNTKRGTKKQTGGASGRQADASGRQEA